MRKEIKGKYHKLVTVDNEIIEIKKNDKKNYPIFIRFMDLYYEIYRLELILCRGLVSKKMFDEIVKKLEILEEENFNLTHEIMMMDQENKLEKYHRDFLKKYRYKKGQLEIKFKCQKCDYCETNIISLYDEFCEECEDEYGLE